MLQPIGVAEHTTEAGGWEGTNAASTRDWFGAWAQEMCSAGRATDAELQRLHGAMFESGTEEFVFSASREEVSAVQTPLLVTAGHGRRPPSSRSCSSASSRAALLCTGKDIYHPAEVAREVRAAAAAGSTSPVLWRLAPTATPVNIRWRALHRTPSCSSGGATATSRRPWRRASSPSFAGTRRRRRRAGPHSSLDCVAASPHAHCRLLS